jgi:hypothetical protein
VGAPVEVSVNWTVCPAEGEAGLKLKDANKLPPSPSVVAEHPQMNATLATSPSMQSVLLTFIDFYPFEYSSPKWPGIPL